MFCKVNLNLIRQKICGEQKNHRRFVRNLSFFETDKTTWFNLYKYVSLSENEKSDFYLIWSEYNSQFMQISCVKHI